MSYSKQTWTDSPSTASPISAARLNNIEGGIISTDKGTFASRPGSGVNTGDLYYCTDIGNEYRWNGSSWDLVRVGDIGTLTPPPSSGWTALNSGSVTADLDGRLISQANNGAADSWKGETRTLSPTSNYTATFYIEAHFQPISFIRTGVLVRNSGSGSFVAFGMAYDSSNGGYNLWSTKWTNVTTFSAAYLLRSVTNLPYGVPKWLRIRDDNTNRYYEYSYNGTDWILHNSAVRTDFITPDQVGWAVDANTATTCTTIVRLRHFAIT